VRVPPSGRGARRRAVRALPVLLFLAGCGGDDPAPRATPTPGAPVERSEPSPAEQIEAVLDDRAAALEAGKAKAYAATAAGGQRRADRVHARRARRLRLRDVFLTARNLDVRGRRATARVTTLYSLAGVRGEFRVNRRVTLRRRGRWRVTRVRARRGAPPWEVGDFVERRSRHFAVLAPAGLDVGDLPDALEDGYATMRELLPRGRLQRRYLVLVTADAAQARALTTRIQGIESLAAISDATVIQTAPAAAVERVVALRLLVVWGTFATLPAEERETTITHELTHAALAGATSGRTPAWLSEGVALYVSGDRRPAPPGADLVALSRPAAIARLAGIPQSDAYSVSSAAAFAIAERFGRRKLLRLYDVFNEPSLRGRPGPRLANRATRRVLGIRLGDVLG
jgi:hypothetical protein